MKALFVGIDKYPFEIEMEDNLNNYQSLVGGNIEVLSIKERDSRSIDIIFNEEGKLINLPLNRNIVFPDGYVEPIMGNIIIVAANLNTGDFESLTDEEINWYKNMFLDDYIFII